jgi:hypothetical protein
MKPIVTVKDFIDQQYEMQKRLAEVADKTTAAAIDLIPKMPTPSEVIGKAIEINKLVRDASEKELINSAKQLTRISVPF